MFQLYNSKFIICLAIIANSNNLIIRYKGVLILYRDIVFAYIINKE